MSEETGRLPDVIDRAGVAEQQFNDDAQGRIRRLAQPEQVRRPDGTWPHTECEDCAGDIEPGRLALGKVRCFTCQEERERHLKRGTL